MTTTKPETIQEVLEQADPNTLADALRKIGVGKMLTPIKVVCTGLTSATSFDITTAAVKAAATITGITLETGENLPPAGDISSLRVTAGTATGQRAVSDAAATPSTTLATLSNDGKTITFEAAVTAFVLIYQARPALDLTTVFAPST